MRVSCQIQVHLRHHGLAGSAGEIHLLSRAYQSLRRTISLLLRPGLSLPSSTCGRWRPRDCASRHVSPNNAHEPSAFMSFKRTKLVISKAWSESKFGLNCS